LRIYQRFGFHHHPLAAAVGIVVGHFVLVGGVISQVYQVDLEQIFFLGSLQDAMT
jgi:hypothetical protein